MLKATTEKEDKAPDAVDKTVEKPKTVSRLYFLNKVRGEVEKNKAGGKDWRNG